MTSKRSLCTMKVQAEVEIVMETQIVLAITGDIAPLMANSNH